MSRAESIAVAAFALHLPDAVLVGDPDAVPAATAAVADAVIRALAGTEARVEVVTPQLVLAALPDVAAAVSAAFAAVAAARSIRLGTVTHGDHAHPLVADVGAGLGFGPATKAVGAISGLCGPEVSRAWRLACVAAPGEVLCSESAKAAYAPAVGVGVFRAPPPRLAAAGFGAHALVDYRS